MIVVCFDHDKIIGRMVLAVQFATKEYVEKLLPKNCSHYDIVNENTYNRIYKEIMEE